MPDIITAESRGNVTVLAMARGKVQALDLELVSALEEALIAHADAALVLTGTGAAFSAGVDLKRLLAEGPEYVDAFLPRLSEAMVRLFSHAAPVVAAINGHAIAGGCVFACACDYKVMAAGGATLGVPELRVGVPFPVAPLEILRFALADPHLQELVYLGRTYDADAASTRGMVDEVVPAEHVVERAVQVATRLATGPVARFRLTKAQLRRPALDRIRQDAEHADPAVLAAWKHDDTRAAIAGFLADLEMRKR